MTRYEVMLQIFLSTILGLSLALSFANALPASPDASTTLERRAVAQCGLTVENAGGKSLWSYEADCWLLRSTATFVPARSHLPAVQNFFTLGQDLHDRSHHLVHTRPSRTLRQDL